MKLSYQEKELEILRSAVDRAEKVSGKRLISSPEIKKIIYIVEDFLRKKKLICYGGTAINNILPDSDKFYDPESELPDYDFFSMHALEDAKELADIYAKEGFTEVEAKSGVHKGTYKVFVNFIPVADITHLDQEIYKNLYKDSINIIGIRYASPNFLRMGMYLELSRPEGDVSRWEKVMKRLRLLNKNYPLKGYKCDLNEFQRETALPFDDNTRLSMITRTSLINLGVIFFGGFAVSLYSRYMPKHIQQKFKNVPDFDVLSENPKHTASILKERLIDEGYKDVKIIHHNSIGEIVAPHYDVRVGKETICFIYEPLACHSYNIIKIKGMNVKIATIDTMLSFYFAFFFSDREYYDENRILCMAQYLFDVQQKNRLEQKGLLRRFSINCYGEQHTLEEMREEKAQKYKELKNKRNSKEFESWFLRYVPFEDQMEKEDNKLKTENKNLKKQTKKHKPKRENKKKRKSRKNIIEILNII